MQPVFSRRDRLRAVATLALVTTSAPIARAQDVVGGGTTTIASCPMTDVPHARAVGTHAAGQPVVAGYALTGFAAGVPAGFLILPAAGTGLGNPKAQIFLLSATGVGVTAALAGRQPTLPTAHAESVRGCAVEFRDAFRDAYVTRLRQRRTRAALWGGATGAVTGVGLLFLLLTKVTT